MKSLEGGESGLSFSSGMAAETAIILSQLKKGRPSNIVQRRLRRHLRAVLQALAKTRYRCELRRYLNLEDVKTALQDRTRMVFIESPANPTMAVCDIREICRMAREADAISVVDNTFASPYFQRPLELGADLVVESCTKYIGGHSDLLGGVVVGPVDLIKSMNRPTTLLGGTMGPHEAWLCIRGLKTLHLRMERHSANAMSLARFLELHPKVDWVSYPGLSSHPQHDIARKQMSGYGGMMSFELKGGIEAGRRLMDNVELCLLSVSLGSTEDIDGVRVHKSATVNMILYLPNASNVWH